MPIYTCRDISLYEGAQELPFWPCDVIDRYGNCLSGLEFYIDTDTGITIRSVLDNGPNSPFNQKMTPDGNAFVQKVELHPAPLSIIPYNTANQNQPIIVRGS